MIKEINDYDWTTKYSKEKKFVLVMVFNNNYPPGKIIDIHLRGICPFTPSVIFLKANAVNVPRFCSKYQVNQFPSVLLLKSGKALGCVSDCNLDGIDCLLGNFIN